MALQRRNNIEDDENEDEEKTTKYMFGCFVAVCESLALLFAAIIAKEVLPHDDESDDDVPHEGINVLWYILLIILMHAVVVMPAMCFWICITTAWESRVNPWRERIEAASRAVKLNAECLSGSGDVVLPLVEQKYHFEGRYHHRTDNGDTYTKCEGVLEFHFPSWSSQMYNVNGEGDDEGGGTFRIQNGKVSPSGKFFWIQQYTTWIPKRKFLRGRLVTGLLDQEQSTSNGISNNTTLRHGYWETSNGEGQTFEITRFDLMTEGSDKGETATDHTVQLSSSLRHLQMEDHEEDINIPPMNACVIGEGEIMVPGEARLVDARN